MSKRFQNLNKFRNAVLTPAKRETWFQELQLSTTTGSDSSDGLAATRRGYVFKTGEGPGNRLEVVGLDRPGRGRDHCRPLGGQSGVITDWSASWFDDPAPLIASANDTGLVQAWQGVAEEGAGGAATPTASLQAHQRRIESIFFHPTCREIVTTIADKEVKVWDVNRLADGAEAAGLGSYPDATDKVSSGCWSANGDLLLTTVKGGTIRLIDPRAPTTSEANRSTTAGHAGLKPTRIIWLDDTDRFLTTGVSKMRERQIAIWDPRQLAAPLVNRNLDTSTGVLIPQYDADTATLYVAGRGDTTLRWFHVDPSAANPLHEVGQGLVPVQVSGLTLVPKASLDVMGCEIARVGLVGKPLTGAPTPALVPVAFHIPRRSHLDFHSELYPNTKSHVTTTSVRDWLDYNTRPVARTSLDPTAQLVVKEIAPTPPAPVVATTAGKPDPAEEPVAKARSALAEKSVPAIASAKTTVPIPPPSVSVASPSISTPTPMAAAATPTRPAPRPKVVMKAGPKLKYLQGKTYHPSQHFESVPPPDLALPADTELLAGSNSFLAYPVKGPGGQVAVLPCDRPARQPVNGQAPLLATGSAVAQVLFDPFRPEVLITAHTDRTVRTWTLPAVGVTKAESGALQPDTTVTLPGDKFSYLACHPLAQDIWAAAVTDGPSASRLVVYRGSELVHEMACADIGPIHHFAWSRDGTRLSVVTRKKLIAIYDARTGAQLQRGPSHASLRPAKVFWTRDDRFVGSVGFGVGSQREVLLFDAQHLDANPVDRAVIGVSPSQLLPHYDPDLETLYLQDRGSAQILPYELFEGRWEALPRFEGGRAQQSVLFMPKRHCNVAAVEVQRGYRLVAGDTLESVGFYVPRKRTEFFQDDLYPLTADTELPLYTAEEWLSQSANARPSHDMPSYYRSLRPEGMTNLSDAPAEEVKRTAHEVQEVMESEENRRQDFISTMLNKARLAGESSDDDTTLDADKVAGQAAHDDSDAEVSDSEW
ncbi:hypothetical protein IWQ60_011497 [Tieghemiomyces parasiticus]|uniref:Coronin n=1 Tax=Tieghemiomyces parasiticus TaxID=78921 RepID=A0A9W8DH84_9FUNG|nr:hypothetical protein IWQ60_011497 [Tieghemiomyces parasiticus]